jgi:DNA polymerase-4
VFLAGDHAAYEEASAAVHEIFRSFTPLVEGIALDEAFLDVSGATRLFGGGETVAHAIRRRVADEQSLTCSVGVAPTKLLAKLASVAAKPRVAPGGVQPGAGVVVIAPGDELAFLQPLPVGRLWGVGPATLERLERLGVRTVGDLAGVDVATLVHALGKANGRHLHLLANGIDDRPVEPDRPLKSVGHEQTFSRDLTDRAELEVEIVRMADAVSSRLRAHALAGRTVTLKVRFGSFATITRSSTAATPLDLGTAIASVARRLLDDVDVVEGVRLLGVAVSGLATPVGEQLSLADQALDGDWSLATRAVDRVRERFGPTAIGPASLVGESGLKLTRRGSQQWGPDAP